MGRVTAAVTLGALLLSGGSWAIYPRDARASVLGELTDTVTGPVVDRMVHRSPPPADLEQAAERLAKPPRSATPDAIVLQTPESGAFQKLLGNDKALSVIDFGAQMIGAPPGTVQAMASLILFLMQFEGPAPALTPAQRSLLNLAASNFGKRCGPYVSLASLQNLEPIDASAPDVEIFCKLLGNGAVFAREYSRPTKR